MGGTGPVNFHAPASGDIVIAIPLNFPGASTAEPILQQIASDWSAATLRNISVQTDTTCALGDALCVELDDDHGTNPNDQGCASLGPPEPGYSYNPSTGVFQGRARIRLEPNWSTSGVHADRLRKVMAHELGHYFGLYNLDHSSCTASNSIMKGTIDGGCYSPNAPDGVLGPTSSDSNMLLAVYDTQPRAICGWEPPPGP
jgi:hypothetical protein